MSDVHPNKNIGILSIVSDIMLKLSQKNARLWQGEISHLGSSTPPFVIWRSLPGHRLVGRWRMSGSSVFGRGKYPHQSISHTNP